MPSLTDRPAWKALAAHHARVKDVHLRTLFADDAGRGERLTAEAAASSRAIGRPRPSWRSA
jgi:glucose-6-phosphate isomerase